MEEKLVEAFIQFPSLLVLVWIIKIGVDQNNNLFNTLKDLVEKILADSHEANKSLSETLKDVCNGNRS